MELANISNQENSKSDHEYTLLIRIDSSERIHSSLEIGNQIRNDRSISIGESKTIKSWKPWQNLRLIILIGNIRLNYNSTISKFSRRKISLGLMCQSHTQTMSDQSREEDWFELGKSDTPRRVVSIITHDKCTNTFDCRFSDFHFPCSDVFQSILWELQFLFTFLFLHLAHCAQCVLHPADLAMIIAPSIPRSKS
jgi:hypothetical protein